MELAREKPRFRYRRLHVLLCRSGEVVNHKRVHRVYREASLALRRKKQKHCVRQSTPLRQHTAANHEWALDFLRRMRLLTAGILAGKAAHMIVVALRTTMRESLLREAGPDWIVDNCGAGLAEKSKAHGLNLQLSLTASPKGD